MSKRVERAFGTTATLPWHFIKGKMVPVLDKNKVALMPCSERRARRLMSMNQAVAYWQKGIFCIKLLREPSDCKYQKVALGIDPGSKREGYTVATNKHVVINITTDTKDWVKDHIETRRNLRRSRRYRKAPYRACRQNRSSLRKEKVPPSTKTRWDTKLQMVKFLFSILPLTIINIEDIKAKTLENKSRWNKSFSPLEVGKKYFDNQFSILFKNIELIKTQGYDTFNHRSLRGFKKTKEKLKWTWEAHNVDSHCLAEMALNKHIKPNLGLWKIEYLEYHRRCLHVQNPLKNNIRKTYGSTVSMGLPRGSVLKYKNKLYYLGGTSKNRLTIHCLKTGNRLFRNIKIKDIKMLYTSKQGVQFI